jgi:uncharacterized Tic20 family protein
MNQPELGYIIAEKRQNKNLSQEQLAEMCGVSSRTIQRIESGEVEPRSYTKQRLSDVFEFDFSMGEDHQDMLWLTLLHLSSCFCLVFISLLLWSWKKNQSIKMDQQGKQVLNFQITMTLVMVSAGLLMLIIPPLVLIFMQSMDGPIRLLNLFIVSITIVPLIITGIFCFIEGIINTIHLHSDKPIKYPLSIKFIK